MPEEVGSSEEEEEEAKRLSDASIGACKYPLCDSLLFLQLANKLS